MGVCALVAAVKASELSASITPFLSNIASPSVVPLGRHTLAVAPAGGVAWPMSAHTCWGSGNCSIMSRLVHAAHHGQLHVQECFVVMQWVCTRCRCQSIRRIRLPAQFRLAADACMAFLVNVWWAWACSCGCSQCVLDVHPIFSSHITRCRSTQAAQDGVGCVASLLLCDILHAASPPLGPFLVSFLLAVFAPLEGHASRPCCFMCLIMSGGGDCITACGLCSTLLGVHLASCCC